MDMEMPEPTHSVALKVYIMYRAEDLEDGWGEGHDLARKAMDTLKNAGFDIEYDVQDVTAI